MTKQKPTSSERTNDSTMAGQEPPVAESAPTALDKLSQTSTQTSNQSSTIPPQTNDVQSSGTSKSTIRRSRPEGDTAQRGYSVRWIVVDEDDQPFEGILVELRSDDERSVVAEGRTSEDGSVVFENVPENQKYAIYVWPEEPDVHRGVVPERNDTYATRKLDNQ